MGILFRKIQLNEVSLLWFQIEKNVLLKIVLKEPIDTFMDEISPSVPDWVDPFSSRKSIQYKSGSSVCQISNRVTDLDWVIAG